ncbi:Nn.00g023320.m01.CDS01 [Neocucurbitaria sp. VM-36]
MTAFVCFVWLREPFTINEALGGLLAFAGVLFVARPPWLFPSPPLDPISGEPEPHVLEFLTADVPNGKAPTLPTTPQQRALAIVIAIVGTFGAATAYATIRVIGKRSHSLISVNYFAAIATIGSTIIIAVHPDLHFVLPKNAGQWGLVAIIGVTGFLLQFLLTEGLQREKGGRATNLTYLQLVFALIVERVIWGTTPPVESLFGASLIIGAAIWVSLQKTSAGAPQKKAEIVDEESSLLGSSGERQR